MKLGKHFIVGFDGKTVSPELLDFLKGEQIGGVILFSRNFESHSQIKDLISNLKSEIPNLLVSVDHEGGRVQRFTGKGFSKIPPMSKVKDEKEAHELGRKIGAELKDVGVDIDFAPVLDIATNPKNPVIADRSFSSDPKVVARFGIAMIKGMMEKGVVGCGKHFPGHGDTDLDSHKDLPILNADKHTLHEREIVPFRDAISFGLHMVMTAHLLVSSLDSEEPVTTSRLVTFDLLRGILGFKGVVVTDDLNMQGILKRYPVHESAWRALRAGADMVLLCEPDIHAQHMAINRARHALEEGELDQMELHDSQLRISRIFGTHTG